MNADPAAREAIATARTLLFVPGDRPDRFAKAAASGADLVVIDLEDAVGAQDKRRAREHAATWIAANRGPTALRINGPGTPWFEDDLALAAVLSCPIMLPKSERAEIFETVADRTLRRCAVIALIETALGVTRAADIGGAPGVTRLAFGNVDLAGQLGIDPDDHLALAHARSQVVLASAAAELPPPLDGVTTAVRDQAALAADVAQARRLGFSGKLCIHPDQVPPVAAAFAPSEDELRWARAVLGAKGAVAVVDGQMIDRPVTERARRLLSTAGRDGLSE